MASVTIGGTVYPNSSLASQADADAYLVGDVARAVRWALLNNDAKGRGLISATRLLLRQDWCGDIPDTSKAQPAPIIAATAMLAADMAAKPKLQANPGGASNVKSAKAGSAQVEFFGATTATANPLPDEVWATLKSAGLVGCSADLDDGTNGTPFVSGSSCGGGCGPCGDPSAWYDDDDRRGGGWC